MLRSAKVRHVILPAILLFSLAFSCAGPPGHPPREASMELTRAGHRYLLEGRLAKARKELMKAVKMYPKNGQAHALLSVVFLKEGKHRRAVTSARRALKLNPQSALSRFVLAVDYFERGEAEAARREFHMGSRLARSPLERRMERELMERLRPRPKPGRKMKPQPEGVPKARVMAVPDSTERVGVAVFPFEDTNEMAKKFGYGATVSEMLTTALIQTNRFKMVERGQLKKVMEEQALGMMGAIDTETATRVGRILGVEMVVVGSVSKMGLAIECDARLINVETGVAVAAVSGKSKREEELRAMVNRMANRLATQSLRR